jgi:hypothetical protein
MELENKFLNPMYNGMPLAEFAQQESAWRQPTVKLFLFWNNVIGGIFPDYIKVAAEEGRLFQHGLDLDLPGIECITNAADSIVLHKSMPNKLQKQLVKTWVKVRTLGELQVEKVQESVVTPKMIKEYLVSIGAKYNPDHSITGIQCGMDWGLRKVAGDWQFTLNGGEWNTFHRYAAINGVAEINIEKVVALFMSYLLASREAKQLTGKAAFCQFLFVDPVNVGFDHSLYSEYRKNKVSMIMLTPIYDGRTFKPGCPVKIAASNHCLLRAVESFEQKGLSVFMQKMGKYIVADAAMVGFHRNMETGAYSVAWKADKLPKLTGRALFTVPTALEWVEEDLPKGKLLL